MSAYRFVNRILFLSALMSVVGMSSAAAPPKDGNYVGFTEQGERMSIDVEDGKISTICVHFTNCSGSFVCAFFFLGTPCAVAGNGSFTCGSANSCPSLKTDGSFSGENAQGTLSLKNSSCCSLQDLSFNVAYFPAPTNLGATVTSSTSVRLTWQDNSDDEAEFRIVDSTDSLFTDIKTVPANTEETIVTGLKPATTYSFVVAARKAAGSSSLSNEVTVTTFTTPVPCVPTDTAMCLNDSRFKVEAEWQINTGQKGPGHRVTLTDDSGYFWFFNDTNVEMIVKVLNGCGVNNRFWVFAAGLTDVDVILKVTDSQTGVVQTYRNPLGTPFKPIQDTNAFETCP